MTSERNDLSAEPAGASGPRLAAWMLWVPLAAHLLLATLYAFMLPLWGAVPDEPLHYSHIKYVAENWRLPPITAPHRDLLEYYFVADPASMAVHGPMYYWTGALLYKATVSLTLRQQQYVMRLYSVALGLLMVYLAWRCFELLFPRAPRTVFASTLLLCLMPHRLMISAVIYADVMAAVTATLAVYMLIRAVLRNGSSRGWLAAGAALGLALMTKQTGLMLVPGAFVALLLAARERHVGGSTALRWTLAFVAGTAALCGWWYVRSIILYGTPVAFEPRTLQTNWSDLLFFPAAAAWQFWFTMRGLWLSVWSQVGWLPALAAQPMYALMLVLTTVVVVGLVVAWRHRGRDLTDLRPSLLASFSVTAVALCVASLHTVMMFPHFNEETGKHAQTLLVPLVALVVTGWRQMVGARRVPQVLLALAGLMLLFNALSIYNLKTNLIPRYAPTPPPMSTWKVKDLPTRGIPWVKDRPNTPNRYLIHHDQANCPTPQDGQRYLAQQFAQPADYQQRQSHHRGQNVASARVELDIHGPVCPLLA